jgi:hypothetical protein
MTCSSNVLDVPNCGLPSLCIRHEVVDLRVLNQYILAVLLADHHVHVPTNARLFDIPLSCFSFICVQNAVPIAHFIARIVVPVIR